MFNVTPSRGYLTLTKLKLHRPELIERRQERLESVQRLLDRWRVAAPGELRDQLRADILAEAEPGKEFSATVRDFLLAQPDFEM